MKFLALPPLLLVLGAVAAQDKGKDKPAPKLPLGKDTTYVVGPLDKDGYVDYEAALNAELSKGITADKNAVVLLWAVFGPTPEGGEGMPAEFYKWLDTPPPPKDGDYFVGLGKYARDTLALTDNQLTAVFEIQSRLSQRPWEAKDCPPIAEWLKANEKHLAVAAEATKRPAYFNPLVSRTREGERGSLIGALLPAVQKCRELASAFSARAMLRLHEGKADAAWEDILACHRLGRLVSRGGTLIEGLVGIAISQIAANTTLGYLDRVKPTAEQAKARLRDLQALPAFGHPADQIDITERFVGLDSLQLIIRGGKAADLDIGLFDENNPPAAEDLKVLERLDWTTGLRNVNTWYDRMAAATRVKDRAAREKAFDDLDKALVKVRGKGDLAKRLREEAKKKGAEAAVATAITDVLMGLLMPAVRKVQGAYDRAGQVERNLHVAVALAAYHADTGRYPAKLDDLTPKYLPAVPGDLFSGKPLVYKPEGKGYLVYSVGQNGKDEGGRWYDDTPPGDDPRVRMPIPAPKPKE